MGVAEPMQIYALRYAPVNTAGARHLPATKDASLAAFRKGIVHLSTLLLGPICYFGSGHQFAKKSWPLARLIEIPLVEGKRTTLN